MSLGTSQVNVRQAANLLNTSLASVSTSFFTKNPTFDHSVLDTTTKMTRTYGKQPGLANNSSGPDVEALGKITWDDATWIMTCCFIIFTMQSGFGLLESGSVSAKNEVNIMVKNAVDIIFGGLSFWIFGFGMVFGQTEFSNPIIGVGNFLVDTEDTEFMGELYTLFIFQLSFCTTSTTIVSGAMAERTKLGSYIVFSFFNTVIYCLPAHWMWGENGFLQELGAIDIAGSSVVHLVGGLSGLVATLMLGPRTGRFEEGGEKMQMGSPTNAMLGMFLLWWGWLAFNCGSTYGISRGKWKLAARASVTTVMSAMGGGLTGVIYSFIFKKRKFDIHDLINGVLGGLVSVTAICAVAYAWEAVVIGLVGGSIAVLVPVFLEWMRIDDPVGVVPVHCACSIWGMLSVGLFVDDDKILELTRGRVGLFRGGGIYLFMVQLLSVLTIAFWSIVMSYALLKVIDLTLGLRMSVEDERLGADFVEHGLACRLELPDGSLITSTEINMHGDVSKLTTSLRINKLNRFSEMYLKALSENQNEGNAASPNSDGAIEEQTDVISGERLENCETAMSNGVTREPVSRSFSDCVNNSNSVRRRENNIDGHSNPSFQMDEEDRNSNYF